MLVSRKSLSENTNISEKSLIIRNVECVNYFGYPWIEISKRLLKLFNLDNIIFEDYKSSVSIVENDGFPTDVSYIKFNSKYVIIDNSDKCKLRDINDDFNIINDRDDILFVIKRNYHKSLVNYYKKFNGKVVPFFSYPTQYFYENYKNLENCNLPKIYDMVALYGNSNKRSDIINKFKEKFKDELGKCRIETNCRYNPKDYYNILNKGVVSLCIQGAGLINEREMESFALGIPIIMPEPLAIMHVNLQPDHNYIKMQYTRLDFSYKNDNMIDEIYDKYINLINDKDKMQFIRENAKAYYNENIQIDSLFKHFMDIYRKYT